MIENMLNIEENDLKEAVQLLRQAKTENQQITVLDLQRVIHKNYEYSRFILDLARNII